MSFEDGRERKIYYSEKTPITYLEPFEYLFLGYCQHIIRQEDHPLRIEVVGEMVNILYEPIGLWPQGDRERRYILPIMQEDIQILKSLEEEFKNWYYKEYMKGSLKNFLDHYLNNVVYNGQYLL